MLITAASTLRRAAVWGLLLAFAWAGLSPARAAQPETPALAFIDLRSPSHREYLQGWLVYAQLYTPSGGEYLLAPLTPTQSASRARQGLHVRLLEADSRSAAYYLLSAYQPQVLQRALESLTPLLVEGRQALVRVKPSQAERLAQPGVEVRRLTLHPLPALRPANPRLPAEITPSPLIQTMIDPVNSSTVAYYNGSLNG